MKTIDGLLDDIDRHKGVYVPNKQAYLDWVFRYNCRLMEWYNLDPKIQTHILDRLMHDRITETVGVVKNHYKHNNSLYKIYVPSVESMQELLEYDIIERGLTL